MLNYLCCVGGSDNDSLFPEKLAVKLHVTQLKFHYFTKDGVKRAKWVADIYEGFVGFKVSDNKVMCSKHFKCGKPTYLCNTPTIYLTVAAIRACHIKQENWIINVSTFCQRITKIQLVFLLVMIKKYSVIYWLNLPCYFIILPEILMWSCILVVQVHQHLDL